MPYKVVKQDDQYCVYKLDANDQPTGDPAHCHDTEDEAQAQVRALYANEDAAQEQVEPARADVLIESAAFVENTVNKTQRTVDVVLIRPGWSLNDRYYSKDVIASAAPLFENTLAYADHPTVEQVKRGESRSVLHVTGRYYNVRTGPDGELLATRKVFNTPAGDSIWPLIEEAIEHQANSVGLSINAVGTARRGEAEGRKGLIVEDISAANSVDDVTDPAAGGSYVRLVASAHSLRDDLLAALDFNDWYDARPEFVERLKREWQTVRQTEAVATAHQERDEAVASGAALKVQLREQAATHKKAVHDLKEAHKQQVAERNQQLADQAAEVERLTAQIAAHQAEIERKDHAVTLERLLRDARLLPEWETALRKQLEKASPADWPAIVQAERAKARAAGAAQRVPVSGAGRQEAQSITVQEHASDSPLPRAHEDYNAWSKRMAQQGKGT